MRIPKVLLAVFLVITLMEGSFLEKHRARCGTFEDSMQKRHGRVASGEQRPANQGIATKKSKATKQQGKSSQGKKKNQIQWSNIESLD